MTKLLLVYVHLIATCLALGLIISTDLRLVAKLLRYRCVIRPPKPFETRVIALALIALCASGGLLVVQGLQTDPHFLSGNEKLIGKMLLVVLLCINAFVLHRLTFPRLAQPHTVSSWTRQDHLRVALPVALSNTLWLYCAFLGIARVWNDKPLLEVMLPAALLFVLLALTILAGLRLAARDEPLTPPDWIDSMKARLSDHTPLGPYQPSFEDSTDSVLPS